MDDVLKCEHCGLPVGADAETIDGRWFHPACANCCGTICRHQKQLMLRLRSELETVKRERDKARAELAAVHAHVCRGDHGSPDANASCLMTAIATLKEQIEEAERLQRFSDGITDRHT